jgi:hypothetical protein
MATDYGDGDIDDDSDGADDLNDNEMSGCKELTRRVDEKRDDAE